MQVQILTNYCDRQSIPETLTFTVHLSSVFLFVLTKSLVSLTTRIKDCASTRLQMDLQWQIAKTVVCISALFSLASPSNGAHRAIAGCVCVVRHKSSTDRETCLIYGESPGKLYRTAQQQQ